MKKLIFLFFVFTSNLLFGATYFVSKDGNDSNNGSLSSPFKTVGKGIEKLSAGDTLYIREGVYKERLWVENINGTENAPILISGYTNEKPIIDGEGILEAESKEPLWEGIVTIDNCQWITFNNLEARNSRGSMFLIYTRSDHMTFSNLNIHHTGYEAIMSDYGSNYLTIKNNRIWWTNIVNDTSSDWYEFFMWGGAISASGTENESDSAAHDILIENNEIYQSFGEGVNIFGHVDGAIVKNNIFWDTWAPAVHMPNSKNVVAEANLIYQTGDPKFLREGDPGGGFASIQEKDARPGDISDITIINNLVVGVKNHFAFWNDELGGPIKNLLVANNTFVDAHSNTGDGGSIYIMKTVGNENIRFVNNIFLQEDSTTGFGSVDGDGITFSHNLWYPGKPPVNMRSSSDIYENPLILREGVIEGGKLTPQYFYIPSNSPAINKGSSADAPKIDFNKTVRPIGAGVDIGAFEFDSTLTSITKDALYYFPKNKNRGIAFYKKNYPNYSLKLYTPSGKSVIKYSSLKEFNINDISLASGFYLYKVYSNLVLVEDGKITK